MVGYPVCNANPDKANLVNYIGSKNVASYFKEVPKIYLNTSTVYGDIKNVQIVNETNKPNPLTVYSKSKLKGEKEFMKFNSISLRLSTVYGLSFRRRSDLLIHDFIRQSLSGNNIEIYEPNSLRSFVNVSDVAKVCYFLFKNFKKSQGNVFNFGDKKLFFTKKQILKKIYSYHNFNYELINDKFDLEKRDYVLDFSKIYKTGFKFDGRLEKNIELLVEYFKFLKNYQ